MNEEIMNGFGLNPDDIRLEFDEKTGEYSLCGKAEIGGYSYNMLKRAYDMQELVEKMDSGESLTEQDLNTVLDSLRSILSRLSNSTQENPTNRFISPADKFIRRDIDVLDSHDWIKESKMKNIRIRVFGDIVSFDDISKDRILDIFMGSTEDFEKLDERDKFFAYSSLYHSMFSDSDYKSIFKAAAKALECNIDVFRFPEGSLASHRVLLKDKDNQVSVIYFK